jgi:hypothetical protein
MVKQFLKRLVAVAAKRGRAPAIDAPRELPTKRLLAIWIGSALIIAAGYLQPSMAIAALAEERDGCWLFTGWFEEGDGWCELHTPEDYKYCGKCFWESNYEPYEIFYESCFGSLDHCIWVPEEEDCGSPGDHCPTEFVDLCEGLDTCIER